ncbi:NAD(P)-binding domain-containing protein [Pseudoalteromonas luteoviolacea]|uniref:NAD(P)-binding domain-containing protein n=1 Tax=Pseudoalteromonas luteoviolacea TaxID=43657 RepID=UPI001F3AD75C|nr:NAD(P)-binding domain-containing protein [Pseudoalteromonas luteoviolacea]MCF6439141.1 NAD(P)-binding domain-containing protein [Pseudoalteromonas luteoviolacea]
MESNHQVVIIGAGPAGMQLSYFLNKAGVSHVVLERADIPGSFFATYPVHRKLISINKVHTGFDDKTKNLRWDWNSLLNDDDDFSFKDFDQSYYPSSDKLVEYMAQFATRYELPIQFNTHVDSITKTNSQFVINCRNNKTYNADILVDATGIGELNVPNIDGIEHVIPYTEMSNDVSQFKNKRILILGKGNSAFETADSLMEVSANTHVISPKDFNFAWVSHYPGHLRSVNQGFLDTFFLKQQNAILNGTIASIKPTEQGQYLVDMIFSEDGERELNTYDHIVNCSGFKCNFDHYSADLKPDLCLMDKFPKLNHQWQSTNIDNLFFCGANMQCNDYKDSSTPFVHGIRHNAQTLAEILVNKLQNRTWQAKQTITAETDLYDAISEQIRRATTIWFLFGNVYDVYALDAQNNFQFYESIPKLVFEQDELFKNFSGYTLEFSYKLPKDESEKPKFSTHGFLHPIIMKYQGGECIDEIHMLEDIYSEWEDLDKLDNGIKEFILTSQFEA